MLSDGHEVRTVTYDMTKLRSDCVNKYRECSGFETGFPKVPTPNLVENTCEYNARAPNSPILKKMAYAFVPGARPRVLRTTNNATGTIYVLDVKQHSEDSNFPNAAVTCLLGSARGMNPKAGESDEPRGKLAKHVAGVLVKILYAALIARFEEHMVIRASMPKP